MTSDFANFFLASAGAGAALVGLLFVAVSIAPEKNVTASAPVERQAMAGSAFTALINAFFISLGALIPGAVGGVAVAMSITGLLNTARQGVLLREQYRTRLNMLRRAILVGESLLAYGGELYVGWQLLQAPQQVDGLYALAWVLVAVYGIGLVRSWQLLGGQRYGVLGWFSPLRDLPDDSTIGSAPIAADSDSRMHKA